MAHSIVKRYTHLNHSGTNHAHLDAETANITGTLEVLGVSSLVGQVTASSGLDLTGASTFAAGSDFVFNGDGVFTAGLSGSLQLLSDGTTTYLAGGSGVTITTGANGQVTISATPAPDTTDVFWTSNVADVIFTTGSIEVTGSATISGSAIIGGEYPERGDLTVGGLDLTPITGTAQTGDAATGFTPTAVLSGTLLIADGIDAAADRVTVFHQFHVLAVSQYDADPQQDEQHFAATYNVTSRFLSGTQSVIGVIELSRDDLGQEARKWDVNVNNDCTIGVTGTTDTTHTVKWYGQQVKEMTLDNLFNKT